MKPSPACGRNQISATDETRIKHGLKVTNNGRKKSRNTNETLIHENCRLALETLTGLRNTERN